MGWLERRDKEPEAWQEAAHFGDSVLYVTAEELRELGRQEQALIGRYLERLTRPELRPPNARLVVYLHVAFPSDLSGPGRAG